MRRLVRQMRNFAIVTATPKNRDLSETLLYADV